MMNRNILNPMMWTTGSWPTPPDYGIYWNPNLGLISLSSDWQERITIADKNLWATQVYNDWDILSEQNCWKYFQRWNNYWFAWNWDITITSTRVNAEHFWPYYESDIFITWNTDWSSVRNPLLRANSTTKQWPAPDWYHVPDRYEFSDMMTILKNIKPLAVWVLAEYARRLKIPFAWYLYYNSPSQVFDQWTQTVLWSTTIDWNAGTQYLNRSYALTLSDTGYSVWTGSRANWCSVRCFKNEPIAPDNTWTTIYEDWNKWVYRNAGLELITITDWSNTISMKDRNLWASVVYSYGDTLSQANCWYYFQRWNNYWFPGIGYTDTIQTSPTQVNATNYWAYYYDETFRIRYEDWSSTNNDNLWWDEVNTDKARRGPCSEWYHVPSWDEISNLVNTMADLGIDISSCTHIKSYLKMPLAWNRAYTNGAVLNQGVIWAVWSTTPDNGSNANVLWITSAEIDVWQISKAIGASIRPFKNESVEPDSTWTKLY